MSKTTIIDWVPFAPPLQSRDLAGVTHSLAQASGQFHGIAGTPSMAQFWQALTKPLQGPSTAPLLAAGNTIAAQIDQGVGAGLGNGYHHATHFKDVMLCAAALTHIASWQGKQLAPREEALLLFSAMVHDLGHDGTCNGDNPLRIENQTLKLVQAELARHNVDRPTSEAVHLMVRSTDVSHTPDYVNYLKMGGRKTAPQGYGALAALGDSKHTRTAELAAMLRDADILLAAGITGATAKESKAELGAEWKTTLGYKDHMGFLDNVVAQPNAHGERIVGFSSAAGKFFNPNIPKVSHALAQLLRPASRHQPS